MMASEPAPRERSSPLQYSPEELAAVHAALAAQATELAALQVLPGNPDHLFRGQLAAQATELAALQETSRAQQAALEGIRAARVRLPARLVRAALAACVCALLLGGSASAGIPSTATGAIGMCYRTAGSMNLLYVLDTAQQPGCPTGMTQSSFNQNPLQVALLRWYDANQVGGSGNTFSVGSFPEGVAFDGANIWVTNQANDTVSKL